MPESAATRPKDLLPGALPHLAWGDDREVQAALEALRAYAEGEALEASGWYMRKRGPKRRMGQWLRGLAIPLTVAAGLVPILSELWKEGGVPVVPPGWSPLLLGLAGLLFLLDRFIGGTSSWMRYLAASQEIGALLRAFRCDWARQQATLAGQRPDAAQIQHLIGLCSALLAGVDRVVREETHAWTREFRSVLRQMDAAAAKAARSEDLGAIQIELSNGDQVSGTWTVQIDGGPEHACAGKRASLTGVLPGIRKVRVAGDIGGRLLHAEAVVVVPEGGVETVSLILA